MTPAQAARAVRVTPAAKVTVGLWLLAWREFFPGERQESTVAHDDYMLGPFLRAHGARLLRSVTRLEAQEWTTAHPSQLRYLRMVFGKALDVGLVPENVWDRARKPRGSGRVVVPPTAGQLEAILRACGARGGWWGEEFAELVTVAAFTGARLGGLARLRMGDVDLDARRMTVTEKGGKTRTIALTARAYAALDRAWWRASVRVGPDPLVFRSQLRRQLTRASVGEAWRAVRGEFPGSFHSLKHFAASWLLEQGLSREDVAIQLGHTDAAGRPYTRLVERVYGHPDHESALGRVERAAVPVGGSDGMSDEPVAMIRGSVWTGWGLFDGPGAECVGEVDPSARLTDLGTERYSEAVARAESWCVEHGFYLSKWSDGDDREQAGEL